MEPAVTVVPSNSLTPRRCARESRPFRVDPPPLVFDMMCSLDLAPSAGGRDGGYLKRGVVLPVAPTTTLVRLVLVGHGVDFRTLFLAHHLGRDRGTGQLGRGG